jgi:RHS repeat-associated protein
MITNGNQVLDYDDENELIRVTVTNSWKNEFVYDGKFRRRIEKDFVWQSGAWLQTGETHFIYDGNAVIQERDTNNLPLVSYARAGSGLLARTDNGLLNIGSSSAHAYYHTDGNGNVTMMINASQAVVAKYLYDPFGNTLSMSGPLAAANSYRFASKEWNASPGFYYFGRRYYDPNLQRWPNRDPIQEAGGLNLYAYVGNDPISGRDPYGLDNIYDMKSGNNAPPAMTISFSPGGGPSSVQYHGGGLGDPLFFIGGMFVGGMFVGGVAEAAPEVTGPLAVRAMIIYSSNPELYGPIAITTVYTLADAEESPSMPGEFNPNAFWVQTYGELLSV